MSLPAARRFRLPFVHVVRALVCASPLWLTACGTAYETIKVKRYSFAILNDDTGRYTEMFRDLIADFNDESGWNSLELAASSGDANSSIIIYPGLQRETNYVGRGQMLNNTESDSPMQLPGRRPKRVVTYAMRLELDEAYLMQNFDSSDATKKTNQKKLFFHEVGHGMELDHDDSSRSKVMHSELGGDKNFPEFFELIRAYLRDQG